MTHRMPRPTWKRSILVLSAMFVAFLAFGFIMQAVQGDDTPNKPIPACEFEDGSGQRSCYWDAETMGNGRGNDYVKVATP